VNIPQKILCCFLLSALLFAGITALAITGVIGNYSGVSGTPAEMLIFVAIFLTLFLIIFFCFNLCQDSPLEVSLPKSHEHEYEHEYEELEELEIVASTDSTSTDMIPADTMFAEAVQVEAVTGLGGSLFMFRQPFSFTPGNLELLQGAGNEVVYEEDGIHYINSNVFADDEKKEEIDLNFANLVESVVNKKESVLE